MYQNLRLFVGLAMSFNGAEITKTKFKLKTEFPHIHFHVSFKLKILHMRAFHTYGVN